MTNRRTKDDFNLIESLNYKIYRDLSKGLNKGFILFDKDNFKFTQNLSNFDLYDFIRDRKPLQLFNILKQNNNSYVFQEELNSDLEAKRYIVENHKEYYEIFKEQVNLFKEIVCGVDFKPIPDRIFEEDGQIYLNMYKKNVEFNTITPKLNDDWLKCKFIINNILGVEQYILNKFIKFLAYKLQNPLDLVPSHWIIQDKGGTGKTQLFTNRILKRLFEVNIIAQTELMSPYNSFMKGTSFIVCEEVEGYDDVKRLKNLTGAETIMLSEKYEKNIMIQNYNSFIIFSNELKSITLSEDDRRFNVVGGGKRLTPLDNGDWSVTPFSDAKENDLFFNDFNNNKYLTKELKNLYAHLMAVEVKRSDVQTILNTPQRRELIKLSYTTEKSLFCDILEDGIDRIFENVFGENNTKFQQFINHIPYGTNKGYWIKFNDFYNFYSTYHKEHLQMNRGLIGKNSFIGRITSFSRYYELFEDYKKIRLNDKTYWAFKLKSYKDENVEIIPEMEDLQ